MLIGSWLFNPMDVFSRGLYGVLGVLDGLVYRLISLLFELFYALANAQLLNNEMYEEISNKVYVFIGVIALFTLSFSLLKSLVNPDDAGKATIKSFKTLITSIILLILMPTIFQYAFSFQNAIMKDDIIGKIFQININQTSGKENKSKSMHEMCSFEDGESKTVDVNLEANYTVPNKIEVSKKQCESNYITMNVLEAFITPYDYSVQNTAGTTWEKAREYMIYTGNFNYVTTFVDQMLDSTPENSVTYTFILSTFAGLFLIYIVLSFCIDLGVRAAKLAFYQLISPIPILMRLIPGKEGQFDKWTKSVISAFLEIFVRLIIINFIIFICSNIFDIIDSSLSFGTVGIIGKATLAIGLFMFAKQAPKLLSEALGFEGGNIKLGIKGKFADGGALALGAGVGGAATTLTRNAVNAFKNVRNADGGNAKIGAALRGAGSMTAGGLSGFVRGVYEGKDAKTYTDMSKAASKAATDAVEKRNQRERYKAAHDNVFMGHVGDVAEKVRTWATGDSMYDLNASDQRKLDVLEEFKNTVKNMEGLWKNEKAWIDADAANNKAKAELLKSRNMMDTLISSKSQTHSRMVENIKNKMESNPSMSAADVIQDVLLSMSAADQSAVYSDIGELNTLARTYKASKDASIDAKAYLDAVTEQIKTDKHAAYDNFGIQLDTIRERYKEYDTYIGSVGDRTVVNKKAYTDEINNLNLKRDNLRNKNK